MFLYSSELCLYEFCLYSGSVVGMLKVGTKNLYVCDPHGETKPVMAPCVLDFYVHESRQRSGLGKQLFEAMLADQCNQPAKMAIDRPSEKLLGFLSKHYSESNGLHTNDCFYSNIWQLSNGVQIWIALCRRWTISSYTKIFSSLTPKKPQPKRVRSTSRIGEYEDLTFTVNQAYNTACTILVVCLIRLTIHISSCRNWTNIIQHVHTYVVLIPACLGRMSSVTTLTSISTSSNTVAWAPHPVPIQPWVKCPAFRLRQWVVSVLHGHFAACQR